MDLSAGKVTTTADGDVRTRHTFDYAQEEAELSSNCNPFPIAHAKEGEGMLGSDATGRHSNASNSHYSYRPFEILLLQVEASSDDPVPHHTWRRGFSPP